MLPNDRERMVLAVYGPYASASEQLADDDTLFWQAGDHRRELEAAHEKLDIMGARKFAPGGGRLTIVGRIEALRNGERI